MPNLFCTTCQSPYQCDTSLSCPQCGSPPTPQHLKGLQMAGFQVPSSCSKCTLKLPGNSLNCWSCGEVSPLEKMRASHTSSRSTSQSQRKMHPTGTVPSRVSQTMQQYDIQKIFSNKKDLSRHARTKIIGTKKEKKGKKKIRDFTGARRLSPKDKGPKPRAICVYLMYRNTTGHVVRMPRIEALYVPLEDIDTPQSFADKAAQQWGERHAIEFPFFDWVDSLDDGYEFYSSSQSRSCHVRKSYFETDKRVIPASLGILYSNGALIRLLRKYVPTTQNDTADFQRVQISLTSSLPQSNVPLHLRSIPPKNHGGRKLRFPVQSQSLSRPQLNSNRFQMSTQVPLTGQTGIGDDDATGGAFTSGLIKSQMVELPEGLPNLSKPSQKVPLGTPTFTGGINFAIPSGGPPRNSKVGHAKDLPSVSILPPAKRTSLVSRFVKKPKTAEDNQIVNVEVFTLTHIDPNNVASPAYAKLDSGEKMQGVPLGDSKIDMKTLQYLRSGAFNHCYTVEFDGGERYVIKIPIGNNSRQIHEEITDQTQAALICADFNEKVKCFADNMGFVFSVKVMSVFRGRLPRAYQFEVKRWKKNTSIFKIELYQDDSNPLFSRWMKLVNNDGTIFKGIGYGVQQEWIEAFVHYSFETSERKFICSDLQGWFVYEESGSRTFLWNDVAICRKVTILKPTAIKFFSNHSCTGLCELLKLTPRNASNVFT